MKKIIGIILAVLMVFSMSTAAFAGFTSVPKTDTPTEVIGVTVALDLNYDKTAKELIKVEGEEKPLMGREFNLVFTVKNDTKDIIILSDVLADFYVVVTDASTKETIELWEGPKAGWNKDLSKTAINPDGTATAIFKVYALTEKSVLIKTVFEEDAQRVGDNIKASYTLIVTKPIETTTSTTVITTVPPTETTTSTTAAPIETTTTTTAAPVVDEETGGYEEPSDEYEAPEVDYEIPNTGSSKAIGGVVALGVIAAGALMLVKKRKSNEENWT